MCNTATICFHQCCNISRLASHCSPCCFVRLLYNKGDLTTAQALDKITTQDYVLVDVRSGKAKAKAGVPRAARRSPQLPTNAKNKLVSVPYEARN